DGRGVNFALFSANGEKVELCLFDETGTREQRRLPLPARTGDIWHGYLAGGRAGLIYGYRVHGPYAPERGQRVDPSKLLRDPAAGRFTGAFRWKAANLDMADNAPFVPKGIVTAGPAPAPPRAAIPRSDTVIYEMHVKGMPQRHPDVPKR